MAAVLGTVDDPPLYLEGCPHTWPETERLRGVVTFTGVFDYASSSGSLLSYYNDYFEASPAESPDLWIEASPITWIDGSEPPFLLIHDSVSFFL